MRRCSAHLFVDFRSFCNSSLPADTPFLTREAANTIRVLKNDPAYPYEVLRITSPYSLTATAYFDYNQGLLISR